MATKTSRLYRQAKRAVNRTGKRHPGTHRREWSHDLAKFRRRLAAGLI